MSRSKLWVKVGSELVRLDDILIFGMSPGNETVQIMYKSEFVEAYMKAPKSETEGLRLSHVVPLEFFDIITERSLLEEIETQIMPDDGIDEEEQPDE